MTYPSPCGAKRPRTSWSEFGISLEPLAGQLGDAVAEAGFTVEQEGLA